VILSVILTKDANASCTDVIARGSLNILTINLLFSEYETLNDRLTSIAQFIADQYVASAPTTVDVLLLQEVVGGALADKRAERLGRTNIETDTAGKLRTILAEKFGLKYQLARAFSNGVPGVLAIFNGTLSRCSIGFSRVRRLPPAEEVAVQGRQIALGRSVLMLRLRIPRYGVVNVYNTHLCANCQEKDRLNQAETLIRFVQRMDLTFPATSSIVAGDLNTNVASINDVDKPLYRLIRKAGFVDSYVEGNPNAKVFCSRAEDGPRLGCTIGVSRVRNASASAVSRHAARIDFIFYRRQGLRVQNSKVIFNPLIKGDVEPSVSDHSAVITKLQFLQ
jgi:maltose 6'-phosphate phosphatase